MLTHTHAHARTRTHTHTHNTQTSSRSPAKGQQRYPNARTSMQISTVKAALRVRKVCQITVQKDPAGTVSQLSKFSAHTSFLQTESNTPIQSVGQSPSSNLWCKPFRSAESVPVYSQLNSLFRFCLVCIVSVICLHPVCRVGPRESRAEQGLHYW